MVPQQSTTCSGLDAPIWAVVMPPWRSTRNGYLGKRLAARLCHCVRRADANRRAFGNKVRVKRLSPTGAATLRNTVQVSCVCRQRQVRGVQAGGAADAQGSAALDNATPPRQMARVNPLPTTPVSWL